MLLGRFRGGSIATSSYEFPTEGTPELASRYVKIESVDPDMQETNERSNRMPRRRRRRVLGLGLCVVLLVVAGAVIVDEQRRPGLFYEYVVVPSESLRTLSTTEQEERKYVLERAREIGRWDGVRRVEWPRVTPYNSNLGRLQTPVGYFTAVLDPQADVTALVRRLHTLVNEAEDAGVHLTVNLEGGEISPASVSPVPDDALDGALRAVRTVRSLDGVAHLALWLGNTDPEELRDVPASARVDVTVSDPSDARLVVKEAGAGSVYLRVQTGNCELALDAPLPDASISDAEQLFLRLCADDRLQDSNITVTGTDRQGRDLNEPRIEVWLSTDPASAGATARELWPLVRESGVDEVDFYVNGVESGRV